MGKTFKYGKDYENTPNQPWQKENEIKKQKAPRSPSTREIRHDRFSEQHVWPLTNTKDKSKKGPKF